MSDKREDPAARSPALCSLHLAAWRPAAQTQAHHECHTPLLAQSGAFPFTALVGQPLRLEPQLTIRVS